MLHEDESKGNEILFLLTLTMNNKIKFDSYCEMIPSQMSYNSTRS